MLNKAESSSRGKKKTTRTHYTTACVQENPLCICEIVYATFVAVMIKDPSKSPLRKEGLVLAQVPGRSHHCREGTAAEAWGSWSHCCCSQDVARQECGYPATSTIL